MWTSRFDSGAFNVSSLAQLVDGEIQASALCHLAVGQNQWYLFALGVLDFDRSPFVRGFETGVFLSRESPSLEPGVSWRLFRNRARIREQNRSGLACAVALRYLLHSCSVLMHQSEPRDPGLRIIFFCTQPLGHVSCPELWASRSIFPIQDQHT